MITGMTVQNGQQSIASITRNANVNRAQWCLSYRKESPKVKLAMRWFRTVNELYAAIRETFPNGKIRYQKHSTRRQAA